MARTKQFYGAVFGWKFEDYGPDYTSFFDGRLAGGFDLEKPAPAHGLLLPHHAAGLADRPARGSRSCRASSGDASKGSG